MPLLTAIDDPIRYRSLVCLENRNVDTIYAGLDVILRNYNKAGYRIARIHCDNEFRPMVEAIQDDLDIELICVPQGAHVSQAERNNRTIGERLRANFHRLP